MKTSCLRLKLVELTSLQVSLLMIRVISMYLTQLRHQDEPFQWAKVAGNCIKWVDPVSEFFPVWPWWGDFSANWTKANGNCMKWIDPVSEFLPVWPWGGWGSAFLPAQPKLLELHEMDRSSLRIFPCLDTVGVGLFCQLNQSCWKLHEMDRSSLRNFPCLAMGMEVLFCQLNQSCWKLHECIDPVSDFFLVCGVGGGLFCQLNWSCWKCMKWVDPVSDFSMFDCCGGNEMDRSSLRIFSMLDTIGGGWLFCQMDHSCWKCMIWIDPVSKLFPVWPLGGLFCQVLDEMFNDAWNTVW